MMSGDQIVMLNQTSDLTKSHLTMPNQMLPNTDQVRFRGQTEFLGWVSNLAGKPKPNRVLTGIPNGAYVRATVETLKEASRGS